MHRTTVGVSPKAPAAGGAATVAVLLAYLLAELFGITVESAALEAFLVALFGLVGALGGAYAARPGTIVTTVDDEVGPKPTPGTPPRTYRKYPGGGKY